MTGRAFAVPLWKLLQEDGEPGVRSRVNIVQLCPGEGLIFLKTILTILCKNTISIYFYIVATTEYFVLCFILFYFYLT